VQTTDEAELSLTQLHRPEVRADPYPLYHRLRAEDPVHWDAPREGWVVTRYADVVAGLHDRRFSAVRVNRDAGRFPGVDAAVAGPVLASLARQMLFADPPAHTRLRGLVGRAFTPRAVEAMRPRVQALVDELLDAAQPAGGMDIIGDFANPLPAFVIADLLGVPRADRPRLKRWSDEFVLMIGGRPRAPTAAEAGAMIGALVAFVEYFRGMVARRRADPGDDLLSALIRAEERGDVLDDEELLANCVLLMAAGHETTTNLIGNGLLALLRHPDQLLTLRQDPRLVGPAVAELLRYDSPVQSTGRIATEEVVLGGKRIARGQRVGFILGAANRDPEQFPDPDRLDVTRDEARHLSFGYGIHFCLGAPLARLEAEIAFTALLGRFPDLRPASESPLWVENMSFRGLEALPVTFG
jgi:cytochrome P450